MLLKPQRLLIYLINFLSKKSTYAEIEGSTNILVHERSRIVIAIMVSRINSLCSITSVLFFLANALVHAANSGNKGGIRIVHKWKNVALDYPSARAESEALRMGKYIPRNIVPLDADYHPDTDRYFVAMPAFRNGTPASLGEVRVSRGKSYVKPFPTWPNFDDPTNCEKGPPLSVYRIHIDKCGLLWVPDTGVNNSLTATGIVCPPKLLVYNLNNFADREILRYEFPKDVVTSHMLILNIITESYRNDCSDTIAYVADNLDYGLIIFDFARKTSWRISHKYFRSFPTAPTLTTNGVSLDYDDGLVGLALSPVTDQERKLYFHSFFSLHESWAPVSVLKNSTAIQDTQVLRSNFYLSPGTRAGHSLTQVMTDDGILIYSVLPNNTLSCWNYRTPFTRENQHVIKKDDENFQFVSGLKLINDSLLITSSRLSNYFVRKINETDFNYRVMVLDNLTEFLRNTPCAGLTTRSHVSHKEAIGSNSCFGPNCRKQRTSSSVGVPEALNRVHNNLNGGASCYGWACVGTLTSSPRIFEPSSGDYRHQSPVNDVSAELVFRDRWWENSHRFMKPRDHYVPQNVKRRAYTNYGNRAAGNAPRATK